MTFSKFYNNIGVSGTKVLDCGEPEDSYHVKRAQRLINGVITEILDPNMFFSRLSFLESSKDAIDIKDELKLGKRVGFQAYKLPSITDKFYTRSSIVKNLYSSSTEGKVRAMFSDNLSNL